MDFTKIIDLLSKSNIDNDGIYKLIALASQMDLSNEDNQRMVIREGAKLANKNIDKSTEDKIIEIIRQKGISSELFNNLN